MTENVYHVYMWLCVIIIMNINFSLFQGVGMGILLGTGQQKIAAIANLFGYYCIGLPSSIVLMFIAKLQVAGLFKCIILTLSTFTGVRLHQ